MDEFPHTSGIDGYDRYFFSSHDIVSRFYTKPVLNSTNAKAAVIPGEHCIIGQRGYCR